MASTNGRTKQYLLGLGYRVAVVEKWNAHARIRQDLFGFGDLLAFKRGVKGVMAVQSTSAGEVSRRVKKILALDLAREWVSPSRRIAVIGWAKRGPRGKRKVWTARMVSVTEKDFRR